MHPGFFAHYVEGLAVEVKLHVFLTSAVGGDGQSPSHHNHSTPA